MLKSQKLQIARHKTITRLNEIGELEGDAYTDEIRAEEDGLKVELRQVDSRIETALLAEGEAGQGDDVDPEQRELARLESRASVGDYLSAALEMRAVGGAAAEFNQALSMSGTDFPLRLLAPDAPTEERATTATDSATMQRGWLDRLLADTAAMRLGITTASVAPGIASYPITTAGATGAQVAKEEAAADTSWSIGVTELKPARNAVSLKFVYEDSARLPGLEAALRRDLRMGMMEQIDRAVFLGDTGATGTDADITGLTTAAITEVEISQANKILGPGTLAAFSGLVDGIHASGFGDLRTVVSVGAWRLWESTVINSTADNMTLAAFLRTAGLSWSSRGSIEDATDDGDFAAFVGRSRGLMGAAALPVWDSASLIRDPYSGAAKGEVALTLNFLWAFGLVRASNFARIKFGS